mgnify:CR=1 FL=1
MFFCQPKTKAAVLAVAESQLGVSEAPANSNHVKYNAAYYGKDVQGSAYLWCVTFVWWVFKEAGFNLYKTASCTKLVDRYKEQAPHKVIYKDFKPGDLIFFDFSGKKKITEHVGICIDCDENYVYTIDGNSGSGSSVNGGIVMKRKRALKYVTVAIRPDYPDK